MSINNPNYYAQLAECAKHYIAVKRKTKANLSCPYCKIAELEEENDQRGEHIIKQSEAIAELMASRKRVREEVESERFNTKRGGMGALIHKVLDNIEEALEQQK